MIEINNKAYRNLQEQVKKNMDDIEMLKKRLGYQGPYDSTSEITHPEDKAIYIIGEDAPYHLYQYDGISQTYLDLGPLNIKGDTGETGAQGPQGERGIRGEQGPEGPQGPQGEQGPQGIQGIQGVQGIQGPAGQDGLTTDIYVNGQTYTQVEGTITLPDYPTSLDWDNVTNKPTFATVATSGSYTDLFNTPTIGDATLTVQRNGTTLGTFTANATSNGTINVKTPIVVDVTTYYDNAGVLPDCIIPDSLGDLILDYIQNTGVTLLVNSAPIKYFYLDHYDSTGTTNSYVFKSIDITPYNKNISVI